MAVYVKLAAMKMMRFSSLFSVESEKSDLRYQEALNVLGLNVLVDFSSVKDNCAKIIKNANSNVKAGPEGSCIVDVPAKGDCWLLALLAPLLGYVVTPKDELGVVKHVRERMRDLVGERPGDFEDIFEDRLEGVMKWLKSVVHLGTWGGDDEFEIFTRITGVVIHVIDSDHDSVSLNWVAWHFYFLF